ncbi:uncharacterized protein BDR25DRAFT_391767 [Lindgomyces ingoldianus]|uniref:Uncharacterized protein n=1 Tax=Lindgomyces ingoldianus TaxID=673940 RepID=A0ACB6R5Z7_9PLEO|nr:uncharacterized protein BDR25DRAFT_391767 [Lindgomyces ingoldianus]KAF2474739.1 hypothetical protein BDR25DRAFT_391767 [Lindgomyces ingoldianus]
MATIKSLRPFLHSPRPYAILKPHRRAFLPNPFDALNPLNPSSPSSYQTLTATRTLPYPLAPIYNIISDVPSYASFLPYCQSSAVTKWSDPDSTYNRKWPSEARLTVGWGSITESFTSRIFCVPGRIVESVGGVTESALDRNDIAHHLSGSNSGAKETTTTTASARNSEGLLTHLSSRWTINPVPKDAGSSTEKTEVRLSLEFAFANPLYSTLSAGVAPKVAEHMIKAFEERVTLLMKQRPGLARASLEDLETSAPLKKDNRLRSLSLNGDSLSITNLIKNSKLTSSLTTKPLNIRVFNPHLC